jgi:putative colanic acid biosynthesis acetyltransferase WcaF
MSSPAVDLSSYSSTFSVKNKIARACWNVCRLVLFRPFVFNAFNPWRVLLLKAFGAQIGPNAMVYASAKIWAPWNLRMGTYSCLGPEVDCYNQGSIDIGAHTTISQKSYLCASSHDIRDPKNRLILKPIVIADQAWVAADAFIGPGVSIGQGAVVGARSAVFADVAAWTVVGGNPAVYIKNRELRTS